MIPSLQHIIQDQYTQYRGKSFYHLNSYKHNVINMSNDISKNSSYPWDDLIESLKNVYDNILNEIYNINFYKYNIQGEDRKYKTDITFVNEKVEVLELFDTLGVQKCMEKVYLLTDTRSKEILHQLLELHYDIKKIIQQIKKKILINRDDEEIEIEIEQDDICENIIRSTVNNFENELNTINNDEFISFLPEKLSNLKSIISHVLNVSPCSMQYIKTKRNNLKLLSIFQQIRYIVLARMKNITSNNELNIALHLLNDFENTIRRLKYT